MLNGLKQLTLVASLFVLSACATVENNYDPLEPVNRGLYGINKIVDHIVLQPVAKGYDAVVPSPVQDGIGNFYSNLGDITTIVNDLLQGKFSQAASDTGRFIVNTTLGIGGLFDVATGMGLEKHNEDFGQTLGYYGYEHSSYFVIPLLGPSTFRDTVGLVGDAFTDPRFYIQDFAIRAALFGLDFVDTRAELLDYDDVLEEQVDEYAFVRDAFLQRRKGLINDEINTEIEDYDFSKEDNLE